MILSFKKGFNKEFLRFTDIDIVFRWGYNSLGIEMTERARHRISSENILPVDKKTVKIGKETRTHLHHALVKTSSDAVRTIGARLTDKAGSSYN